jgi:hypothetical protein
MMIMIFSEKICRLLPTYFKYESKTRFNSSKVTIIVNFK